MRDVEIQISMVPTPPVNLLVIDHATNMEYLRFHIK